MECVLKDLIAVSKDGEWGKGEAFEESVEMLAVRGTDFEDVRFGSTVGVPRRHITKRHAERKILQPWDVVIEAAGGTKNQITGRTVLLRPQLFSRSELPLTCASFSRFIRFNTELCDPAFMFWYLQHLYASGSMNAYHTQHTGVARFQWTTFSEREPLEIPSLDVQRRVAGILSAYDELIGNSQRRIQILETMARALYREWFVHFRFPGDDGVSLVASSLGDIPQGWRATTLGEFVSAGTVTLQTGPFGTQLKASHYATEGTPVINVRNIGFGSLRGEKLEYLAPDRADEHKRHRLREGDIVFGRKGAVERHLLVGPNEEGWIQGSDCIRLRIESGPLTPRLLSIAFREDDHQRWMMNQCSGAATMASLNQDILCRIPLVVPPSGIISKFDEFATGNLRGIDTLLYRVQNLRRTRDLLLPRLLSGQVESRQ